MKNRLSILLLVVCLSAGTIACSTDEPPMPSDTPTQTTPTPAPDEGNDNEGSTGNTDVENPEEMPLLPPRSKTILPPPHSKRCSR